jgi:hypothetical protein
MTTKDTTPTSTPTSTAKTIVKNSAVTIASQIGALVNGASIAKIEINKLCMVIHKQIKSKKIQPVGTLKSDCPIMGGFLKELTAKSLAQPASAFRKACNEGRDYDLNSHRVEKKGAKASKANETKPVVKLIVVKGSDSFEVAMGLRDAINDKAFRENYAELASFLVDALDEFECN